MATKESSTITALAALNMLVFPIAAWSAYDSFSSCSPADSACKPYLSTEASSSFAFSNVAIGTAEQAPSPIITVIVPANADRPTTTREEVVGEIRSWSLLGKNWDAEGADAPILSSLRYAALFVNLLSADAPLPVPMIHATGRAGLYWNESGLYADLEFYGDGRVTYYIEQTGDGKHKGVVNIKDEKMPAVFLALLRA